MNVSLTPELEKLVQEKVKSGLYHSASEVIRDALRLLQERDELR
jgi:antitoxin ParD1/3/4